MNHIATMTTPIIEYLTDKPNMKENETQTDLLLNKPSVGKKQPQKHLVLKENEAGDRAWTLAEPDRHISTQIVAEDYLYDFNREVEPILSVLITKTLEQARMEVLEEEEMRIMKDQKKRFEQKKVSELAEVQRYEASEKRLEQENTRRKVQSQLIQDKQVGVHKQLCARMVAKGFLRTLMRSSLEVVDQIGYFEEDNTTQLHSNFMPWLYDEVCFRLDKYNDYAYTISRMVDTVEEFQAEAHAQSLNNNIRKIEKAKNQQRQKELNKIAKRQRKIEERAKQAEIDRVNELRTYVQANFGRLESIRDKNLTISDCNGITEAKNRLLACLPGGLLLELYSTIDCLKRISEMDEFKNIVPNINPKFIRNLLKNMLEYRQSKDCEWKYELGYRFDPVLYLTNYQSQINQDEKKDEFEAIEKLKALSSPLDILQQLKTMGNEQLLLDFCSELFSSLTFYFREWYDYLNPTEPRPKIKLPASGGEDEPGLQPSVSMKPEEKKPEPGSKNTAAEAEIDFANTEVNSEFSKFQPGVMNLVHEGIMRYALQEDKEKSRRN